MRAVFWPFLRPALRRVAPYMPAGDALVRNAVHAVRTHGPTTPGALVDLGSGDGVVVIECARQLPGWRFVGVEDNQWLVLASRWRSRGLPINYHTGDLYKHGWVVLVLMNVLLLTPSTDLSRYSVIFVCLVPSMLSGVEERALASAAPGTLLLSARFPLPNFKPIDVYAGGPVSGLWVYKV